MSICSAYLFALLLQHVSVFVFFVSICSEFLCVCIIFAACFCVCLFCENLQRIFFYSGVKKFLPLHVFFFFFLAYLSHLNDSDHQTNFNITQR